MHNPRLKEIAAIALVLMGIAQLGLAFKYLGSRITISAGPRITKPITSAAGSQSEPKRDNRAAQAREADDGNQQNMAQLETLFKNYELQQQKMPDFEAEKKETAGDLSSEALSPEPPEPPELQKSPEEILPSQASSDEGNSNYRAVFAGYFDKAGRNEKRFFWPRGYSMVLLSLLGIIGFGLGVARLLVMGDAPSLLRFANCCVLVGLFAWAMFSFLTASGGAGAGTAIAAIMLLISAILVIRGFNTSYIYHEVATRRWNGW